jgi:hypothetical protein
VNDKKQTDWLLDSWLASASKWALDERIERYETKLNSGMSVKTEAVEYELTALKGEQARRIAFELLIQRDWTHNQPIHMYKGKAHYSNVITYERFGAHLVDQCTKDTMDQIIETVKGIDPALFGYLIDRLPDSFIDPIIIMAEQANDCVYLVGNKAIDD